MKLQTLGLQIYFRKYSDTGVFLCILQNFQELLFYWTCLVITASIDSRILDIAPWINWVSDYEIKWHQKKPDSNMVTLVDIHFVFLLFFFFILHEPFYHSDRIRPWFHILLWLRNSLNSHLKTCCFLFGNQKSKKNCVYWYK